jgi:hypothetical protein
MMHVILTDTTSKKIMELGSNEERGQLTDGTQ